MGPTPRPLEVRLWAHVRVGLADDCWPWTGQTFGDGYGKIRTRIAVGRYGSALAHRVAFMVAHHLPTLPLECVLHRCDNPPCCNPAHLFLGTRADNVLDMITKGRMAVGERRWNFRLSREAVQEIRASHDAGVTLAARFGISKQHVSEVRNGKKRLHG